MGLPVKSGGQRSITLGGHTFDWDPVNNPADIVLIAEVSGASTKYSSGRKGLATSGYQVPVGKTL